MKVIKYVIGSIAEKLFCARMYYRNVKNSASVENQGGTVSGHVNLGFPQNIEIGDNSYINGGDISASPNARIVIGRDCMISYNVHIRTDMHNHRDKNIPMKQQGYFEADIIIGNDVWIGYGAQIMAGVCIADGCIIGAGAVVTKNTEPYGVYAGVPARRIKDR